MTQGPAKLWEVEVAPAAVEVDREARRVLDDCRSLGIASVREVHASRSFLLETGADRRQIERVARELLADALVETFRVERLHDARGGDSQPDRAAADPPGGGPPEDQRQEDGKPAPLLLNVLYRPGVTDNVAASTRSAIEEMGVMASGVATCRKYRINADASRQDVARLAARVLANDAIERVLAGPLRLETLAVGRPYEFRLITIPLRNMTDEELQQLSRTGQLYLSLAEMQTVQRHFAELGRDPTDAELETLAQTWSEHCSHKTLRGRIRYRDAEREIQFENLLKETIFAATRTIRERLGEDDWCVSVFEDNAGIVCFDETQNVCMKVETHNHPSALEPYGGANTGLGGVIRDPLGTGLGARPVCNTDVFCFAPSDTPLESLPPGVLHPRAVLRGVVAGVRDYGNRMGIPTVNGAVYFDERYLGNPLVYCGNVAMIPAGKCRKHLRPGDLIVAVGGRTGRDGIHGATFSSAELTEASETLSGGAVQIGNAITEKMLADVILAARDRGLYSAITDCGAGGFSSAVGEMGEQTGAEVWLERAPLKYSGLSYTEIWISEAQERMVLAVPPDRWDEFEQLCRSEGVEATVIGRFTDTRRLVLTYDGHLVADLSMQFLHEGRPPVVRDAVYVPAGRESGRTGEDRTLNLEPRSSKLKAQSTIPADVLRAILASPNVASKEWIIRQYDHEVQAGSVVKPLVGVACDGPSDAAVVRPDLSSWRGLVIACGMNPRYGGLDPYWMAASAIDEAVRNAVAVGADPRRIAILDNFCWGNTERPEVLGTLVRAAIGCRDVAIAYGTPFISGKDSLNNEFSYTWRSSSEDPGVRRTVTIPPSLLISALGQIADVRQAVTMDLKEPGNRLYLVGRTHNELGGSHYELVTGASGGAVPRVDGQSAPAVFQFIHAAIGAGLLRSCHDLSEGGLAAALAEMSFAGGLGVDVNLAPQAAAFGIDDGAVLLFSESNTRFLVEVPAERQAAFEALATRFAAAAGCAIPLLQIGRVADHDRVRITAATGGMPVDVSWADLKAAWQAPLQWD
ncbi:MAG TPA: phosphoribosylformylglycinamidine synthase subunit PurL [Planctomycetaceae bacterium]|nr:phosphoribosylformylglycinamidine synthase subunit PurL [Planctomycetaceae bacterium]